jgi:hypothetical protein
VHISAGSRPKEEKSKELRPELALGKIEYLRAGEIVMSRLKTTRNKVFKECIHRDLRRLGTGLNRVVQLGGYSEQYSSLLSHNDIMISHWRMGERGD